LLLALAASISSCSLSDLPIIGKPAATMDGHSISMSDYNDRLKLQQAIDARVAQINGRPVPDPNSTQGRADERQREDRAVQLLVDEALTRDEADKLHLSVGEDELNQAIDTARTGYQAQVDKARQQGQRLQSYQDYIASFGYTQDSFRDALRKRAYEQKLENKLAKQRADAALSALRSGTDITEVAKKWSDDPASAPNGGEATYTTDQLKSIDPAVKPALDALQPGQMSGDLVRGVKGWFLFKVSSRDDDTSLKFDAVQITAPDLKYYDLVNRPQWFKDHLAALEKSAHVHYNVGTRAGGK
jgi:hypothetical protein